MKETTYEDISITGIKYLLKFAGAWLTDNNAEEFQRKISLAYMTVSIMYATYATLLNIYLMWGDVNYCVFLCINFGCIFLVIVKMLVTNILRPKFIEIIIYVQRNFWHNNYNDEELKFVSECRTMCKLFIIFLFLILLGCLAGYLLTPIIQNIGLNKTERVLPYREWVEVTQTPYYELLFLFQLMCINVIGVGYVCFDTFLCIVNMYVVCQFRMLQYKMTNIWNIVNETTDTIECIDHCYEQLKKCIRQHQMLIEFCNKLENLYHLMNGSNMLTLGVLFSLDCYEIFLADTSPALTLSFTVHMGGTFIVLVIITNSCYCLMKESMNVGTTIYSGSWFKLPMTKTGRSLRTSVKIIMMRAMRPCVLTAAGFFPLTLESITPLMSTTFSYFTLIRESTT